MTAALLCTKKLARVCPSHARTHTSSTPQVLEGDALDDLIDTLLERDDAARLDKALDTLLAAVRPPSVNGAK